MTRAKVFFLYVIMLFQKSQLYFLLNSLLHNNSHFISLDYFENSLGTHYFSLYVCGCATGNSHIITYLKKMFRLFNGCCLHKKTETVVRLCAYASMILFINPENFQFVQASGRGFGM